MRADRVPVVLLSLASDGRLAELVGLGSERAFEELFERHHRPVLAFCAHMLGSWEEAEDAAQQAFVAAYGELARGNRPRALRPWLYGVARHRCLAALEARRARPDTGVAEPSVDALLRHVAVREDLRAILADVAGLPEDQRAALVLAELGGLAHGEIAPILGCRPDKVRALVFQARSSLATGRAARDTPCAVVREQLATLNGAALRRRVLRRHLRDCADCRAYRERANGRSRALGLLLPAVSAAGLKRAVLGSVLGSGGGGAGGGALIAACVGGSGGLAATALVVVAIPAGVVGAAVLPSDRTAPAAPRVTVVPGPVAAMVPATRSQAQTVTVRRIRAAVETPAVTRRAQPPAPVRHAASGPAPAPAVTAPVQEAAAPAASVGAQAPVATGDAPPEQRPAEPKHAVPPGLARAGAPDPPGQTRAEPPGQARANPPGQARAEPPGQARAEPPGQARAEPPGQARAEPPGQARANPPGPPADHGTPPEQALDAPGHSTVLASPPSSPPTRSNPSAARCGCSPSSPNAAP